MGFRITARWLLTVRTPPAGLNDFQLEALGLPASSPAYAVHALIGDTIPETVKTRVDALRTPAAADFAPIWARSA